MSKRFKETAVRFVCEIGALRTNDMESHVNGPDGLIHRRDHAAKVLSKIMFTRIEQIKFSGRDTHKDFSWRPDDLHAAIGVPFRFKHRYQPENIQQSLQTLASFITYNGLHKDERVRVVGGLTHRPFAIAAKRYYGFHTAPIPVNPKIDLTIHNFYNHAEFGLDPFEVATAHEVDKAAQACDLLGMHRQANQSPALFAYMPTEEFLDQYGNTEAQAWRADPPRIHEIQPFSIFGYPVIPDDVKIRGR